MSMKLQDNATGFQHLGISAKIKLSQLREK